MNIEHKMDQICNINVAIAETSSSITIGQSKTVPKNKLFNFLTVIPLHWKDCHVGGGSRGGSGGGPGGGDPMMPGGVVVSVGSGGVMCIILQ